MGSVMAPSGLSKGPLWAPYGVCNGFLWAPYRVSNGSYGLPLVSLWAPCGVPMCDRGVSSPRPPPAAPLTLSSSTLWRSRQRALLSPSSAHFPLNHLTAGAHGSAAPATRADTVTSRPAGHQWQRRARSRGGGGGGTQARVGGTWGHAGARTGHVVGHAGARTDN